MLSTETVPSDQRQNRRLAASNAATIATLPFAIWLLYGFLEQVPLELEEASIVDGAGPYAFSLK